MTVQPVTVQVPSVLYDRIKRRADQSHRPVEVELLDLVAISIPGGDELPDDLAEAIASLTLLDDQALWRAARSRLAADIATRLEDLHRKRQREGLTGNETQEAEVLVRQYERIMLVRAQAAALLKDRGYDVSEVARSP